MQGNKEHRKQSWISPKVEVRPSLIHGKGMFAITRIDQSQVVVIWGGNFTNKEEAERAKKAGKLIQQIGDDVFEVFSVEDRETDPTYFMNHSCDPNVWMQDEVTLVARRNLSLGEELTIDYALFEADENFVGKWSCVCGSRLYRKGVTGKDWRLPELQIRYRNHFSPLLNKRIANSKS